MIYFSRPSYKPTFLTIRRTVCFLFFTINRYNSNFILHRFRKTDLNEALKLTYHSTLTCLLIINREWENFFISSCNSSEYTRALFESKIEMIFFLLFLFFSCAQNKHIISSVSIIISSALRLSSHHPLTMRCVITVNT